MFNSGTYGENCITQDSENQISTFTSKYCQKNTLCQSTRTDSLYTLLKYLDFAIHIKYIFLYIIKIVKQIVLNSF